MFEDKEMEATDIFGKVKFMASLWASTDKAVKDSPFRLIML